MKIEDEIKQDKFRNHWQKATLNLLYTNNWIENEIKSILKPYGVTQQQFNVLRILKGQYPKPITTSVIRNRMLDKMSDASRIVDRLYKKGLLHRQTCSSDKRLVDVTLNSNGLELLAQIDEKAERLDLTKAHLSEDEVIQLNKLLDKMRG